MFKVKNSLASSSHAAACYRPQHITPFFFLPIILFYNAQNIIILFSRVGACRHSSRLTVLVDNELLQHVLLPLLIDSLGCPLHRPRHPCYLTPLFPNYSLFVSAPIIPQIMCGGLPSAC